MTKRNPKKKLVVALVPTKSTRQRKTKRKTRGMPRSAGMSDASHHFIACSFNPFIHGVPAIMPDGNEMPVVPFENRTLTTLTATSNGSIELLVLPNVGNNLYYRNSNNDLVTNDSDWTAIAAKKAGPSLAVVNKAFRTVALAVMVTPISAPVDRAGVCFVDRYKANASRAALSRTITGALNRVEVIEATSFQPVDIMSSKESFNGSLTEMFYATASQITKDHEFVYFHDQEVILVVGDTFEANPGIVAFPMSLTSNNCRGYDYNYSGIKVKMESMQNNSKYLVEVRHCIEVVPKDSGDWVLLAQEPPKLDSKAMEIVANNRRTLPSGGFFSSMVEMGKFALPYIGAAVTKIPPGAVNMLGNQLARTAFGIGNRIATNMLINPPNVPAITWPNAR